MLRLCSLPRRRPIASAEVPRGAEVPRAVLPWSGAAVAASTLPHVTVPPLPQDGITVGRGDDAEVLDIRHIEQIVEHSQVRTSSHNLHTYPAAC